MATIKITNNSVAQTVTIGSTVTISPTATPAASATAPYITDFSTAAKAVGIPAYRAYQTVKLDPGKVLTITSTDSQEIAYWQSFKMDNVAVVVTDGVIADPAVSSIAITTAPTKTSYTAGETFDAAGMVVTATYDNGSTAVVTGYTTAPTAALTTSDTSITVTYATKTATQAITVASAG